MEPAQEWLAAYLRENPDTADDLSSHGIRDDDSYLAGESELPADLRRRLGVYRAYHLAGTNSSDPCLLAKAAPPWLRPREMNTLNLSAQSENVFHEEGIRTVDDLAKWSMAELLGATNLGLTSLANVLRSLVAVLEEGPVTGNDTGEADGLLKQFRQSLVRLSERERDILTRHLGFERNNETLQQIGDHLGLTTEGIRMIKIKALKKLRLHNNWYETFERKMAVTMRERKQPLTISGMEKGDLWFKGISVHWRFCENLIATISKNTLHVIEIDGVRYICSMPTRKWNAMVSSTALKLRRLTEERWSETEIRNFAVRQLPAEAQEFADLFWRTLSPKCQFAALPGGVRVFVGYGHLSRILVQKILSESDKPLHYTKIFELAKKMKTEKGGKRLDVKNIHLTAASVGLLFGSGTFGLRKHLLLSDEQVTEIRDAAESVISSRSDKQWHSSEILSEVHKRLSRNLENLDKYTLEIVLAGSKRLTSLGRMIWVAAGEEQDRKHIHSEVVAILEESGRPLSRREIRERLRSGRGVDKTFQIPVTALLVPLENYLWGINDRDVPVTRERQLELIDILVRQLEAKQCGVHESELHEFLELDGCHPRTFASIATLDSRLKKDYERYLYLAKWGKPRRRSIKSALLHILNEPGEPPTVKDTVERVEAIVRRKCNKQSISNALRALRATSRE